MDRAFLAARRQCRSHGANQPVAQMDVFVPEEGLDHALRHIGIFQQIAGRYHIGRLLDAISAERLGTRVGGCAAIPVDQGQLAVVEMAGRGAKSGQRLLR